MKNNGAYSQEHFLGDIQLIMKNNECGYIEAVAIYVEKSGISEKDVVKLVSPILKKELYSEAITLNFLKKKKGSIKFD